MKMINLHKALKIKNRLVGEIKHLRDIARRENSRKETSKSKVNLPELYQEINTRLEKLVRIKDRISRANVEIYMHLETMSEAKTTMEFFRNLNTSEDDSVEYRRHVTGSTEPVVTKVIAFITQQMVDDKTNAIQIEINRMQDEIDEYNARTMIEWEE